MRFYLNTLFLLVGTFSGLHKTHFKSGKWLLAAFQTSSVAVQIGEIDQLEEGHCTHYVIS
jgi:hypothetical protein